MENEFLKLELEKQLNKNIWNEAIERAASLVDIELYTAKDRLAKEIRKLKK